VSSAQQEQIIDFLNAGKALYIESVDVATSLEDTDLLDMLGISLISQGNYSATVQNLQGAESSFADSFELYYSYDSELDYLVDELQVEEGSALLQSQDEIVRTTYYENEYRVISSSILFGGMKDGSGDNKKAELMKHYLAFLEYGLQPSGDFLFDSVLLDASLGFETESFIQVKNVGLSDFIINSYSVIQNNGFSLGIDFPISLNFDSTVLIPVLFSNEESGFYQETIELQTNAGNFSIELTAANHQAANIQFSPIEFTIELSPDEEFYTTNLNLQNSGEYLLDYSLQLFQIEEESFTDYDYHWGIFLEYNWQELEEIGENINFQADSDVSESISLENEFVFYGTKYDAIYVSKKGFISFLPFANHHNLNTILPNHDFPLPLIAPFWDDLTDSTGEVYFYQDEEKAIVQFENRSRFSGITEGNYTFQIILYEDSTIKFQYKELSGNLESSTVGLQNEYGEKGVQIAYNETFLTNEMAIILSSAPEWLSLSQNYGLVQPQESDSIELVFQVTDLRPDDYFCSLIMKSNAPEQLSTVIPIHLTVVENSDNVIDVLNEQKVTLKGNYPNPFNPLTKIMYELQEETDIKITIYNPKGQKIKQIEQLSKQPGINYYLWNGTDFSGKNVSSGVYYYQLETENYSAVKRMILMK